MKKVEKSINVGGRKLTLTTGELAAQADGAVMASYGETVVLATVMSSPLREDRGYFPLSVDYAEKLYAGGRIKGSRWVKREGRPTDDEILTARLIDRSIRPLFPKAYTRDVQVIITVLSVDIENSPDFPAAMAVSASLASSPIPWDGPIGIVKVGLLDGKLITNPQVADLENSDMELFVSTVKDAIIMIEAKSNQVDEKTIHQGIVHGQKESAKLIKFINDFSKSVGVNKFPVQEDKISPTLQNRVNKLSKEKISELVENLSKTKISFSDYDMARDAVAESFDEEKKAKVSNIFDELVRQYIRKMALSGKRPDGRKLNEIRELSSKVGILPRTHGSSLFNRGQTQVMNITTLGAPSLEQTIETAEGEETKRYIHHYTMPPFSTGDTGRYGFPSRREIGHGALAEKALLPVIPQDKDFPYTIRTVSEVLSSNGSTSMASACAASLSLMDAGVPIKAPVAGIAMGLVIESDKKFSVITDIAGIEDVNGDMDFKVAGTNKGITVMQLDVKTKKLSAAILKDALAQAKSARMKILSSMDVALKSPREKVSEHAPKIKVIKVPQDKIGEVIGPGGKVIRGIIAETGAQVEIEDDGSVNVTASTEEQLNQALEKIEALTKEFQSGEIYEGEVKRIQPFGAFVEVLPQREGLVHVSDMSTEYVEDPNKIVSLGDKVKVRVKEVDDMGRLNLSMLLKGEKKSTRRHIPNRQHRSNRPNIRGKSRNNRRSSGPHFPTSRFLDQGNKSMRSNDRKKRFSR